MVPPAICRHGTGITSSFTQRQAVVYEMPWRRAQSANFTNPEYHTNICLARYAYELGSSCPHTSVGPGQPKVAVTFDYASQSDPGPYPIPANAPIEGGPSATGDRHVLVVDSSTCTLYGLFAAQYVGPGWHAGSGAVFNLSSDALRPDYWTSADAAGLPILAGLVRYDEAAQNGEIGLFFARVMGVGSCPLEVQATGEGGPFPGALMSEMLALAQKGIQQVARIQEEALAPCLPLPW